MRRLLDKLVVLTFVLVIGYLAVIIGRQEMYLSELHQETSAMQQRFDEASKTNAALKQEKSDLEKPEYVEKVAREELGMTKPGEVPYISAETNENK